MRAALSIAILMLTLGFSSPAAAGDPVNGYTLATEHCARCHDIEKGSGFKMRPPSFQSIAIYRREEDIWARILLPSPHSSMPESQWALTPEQIQDLTAYIVSLDTPVSLPAQ